MLIEYGRVCDPDGGGSVELWNNARTVAYANNGLVPGSAEIKGCECDTLEELINEGQEYSLPALDPIAPWHDPGDCDSLKFAGMLMLDIQGIDDAFVEREVIQGFNVGGSFGPLRRRPKVFTFRALLIGQDHCGANFGLNWLRKTLHNLDDGCDFTDLQMFECCPCIENDCDHERDLQSCIFKYQRTFKKVALLNGPNVTRRIGSSCGCGCGGCALMEVEWTFGVGSPFKFRETNKLINGVTARNFPTKCVEWFKTDEDCSCSEEGCTTCGETAVTSPPRAPQITRGGNICSQPVVYAEQCFMVGQETIPDTGESVLQVTVENNSGEPVYGATVVVIPNANDTPCDQIDECDACSTISVDCVPPYSTYFVDGTTRKAEVRNEGIVTPCPAPVGTNCFPVLDPCINYCVCVRFANTPPPNVRITVGLVTRE